VLLHDHPDLVVRDALAELRERILDVQSVDRVVVVHVERFEYGRYSRLSQIPPDVDGGGDEFGVIDLSVVIVINLSNDVIDFFLWNDFVEIGVVEDFAKFFKVDESWAIFVDVLERLGYLIVFLGLTHFDENVESSSAELGLTFELFQALQNFLLLLWVLSKFASVSSLHLFEPGVLSAFHRRRSKFGVDR
jgi:hypothetical protein